MCEPSFMAFKLIVEFLIILGKSLPWPKFWSLLGEYLIFVLMINGVIKDYKSEILLSYVHYGTISQGVDLIH